ncbi:MAG: WcaF family extracellular polysaccharide biosynthesis acetyltransferase [Bacteroidota bacterium]
MKSDLSSYNNDWYHPGPVLKRLLWFWTSALFFRPKWIPFSSFYIFFLRLFGAKIGNGVVVKPGVQVKYPWFLKVGDHSWIGEDVWIDNLAEVTIGSHVCISQGALLECGNHDYSKGSFDLIIKAITIEDGVWIGARSIVPPGVICKDHSVLSANSRAPQLLEAYGIYDGSPAVKIKDRVIA